MNKKIIIISLIIISIFITGIILKNKFRNKKISPDSEIQVSIFNPEYKTITPTIESFGTVQYKTKTDITCLQDGQVINKMVSEGDYVKKGQILYILKNTELEIQHSQYLNELNSNKANIDLYLAKLEEHKQTVKSALLNIKNKELEVFEIEKQIKIQKDQLEKTKALNSLGGISDQAVVDFENQISSLETSKEILTHQLSIAKLGYTEQDLIANNIVPSSDPSELQNQILELNVRSSQADLTVAKTNYENAKKNVELIEKLISDLTIRSPIEGIVGITYFENGEYISKNEKIITVMDISTCIASIKLQESQINSISNGMNTIISIPSINKEYATTISEISPFTDPATGVFFVKANFSNPDLTIRPGMFVKCLITSDLIQTYIEIPESALVNTQQNTADCFCVQNDIAIKHSVKINFIKDGKAYIEEGILPEDKVINFPSPRIKEGTHVKII